MLNSLATYFAFLLCLSCLACHKGTADSADTDVGTTPDPTGRISYSRVVDQGHMPIWVVDADGSNAVAVTDEEEAYVYGTWSPDLSQLAACKGEMGNLWVMDADGANGLEVAKGSGENRAAWSPDGDMLVFEARLGATTEIFFISPDGEDKARLTHNDQWDQAPDWSPDGSSVVFERTASGGKELFSALVDGTAETQLSSFFTSTEWPRYSPDGDKIVYQQYENGRTSIWVMNADGSDEVMLTDHQDNTSPSWSPDGNHIVYVSFRDGQSDLYIMTAAGEDVLQLTDDTFVDRDPEWIP